MDAERFAASVHGKEGLACLDCHAGMSQEDHAQAAGGQAVNCSQCHEQKSGHGSGAGCADCHGAHYMLPVEDPASRVTGAKLAATCGTCHPGQAGRPDYLSWLPSLRVNSHGKQDFKGDYSGRDCLDCHRGAAHGGADPQDGPQCRRCHGPDEHGRSRLAGFFHPRAEFGRQPGTYAAAVIDMVFLGVMFLAGLGFFCLRARRGRAGGRPGGEPNEHRDAEL
ncbi:MAG: hypothetical protein KQI62_06980 [Deltaproteobacteria bacterium]|nr:hypothetical protein [Deltaproteobacteria bacterium]